MVKASYGHPFPYENFIKDFIFNDVFITDNYLTFIGKNRANKDLINSFNPRIYPGILKTTYTF